MADVKLSDAIRDLRGELQAAITEGAGKTLRFKCSAIELELEVVVTAKAGGQGGVDWWIFKAEASGEASRERTHKLKLTLQPVDAQGGDQLISGRGGETG